MEGGATPNKERALSRSGIGFSPSRRLYESEASRCLMPVRSKTGRGEPGLIGKDGNATNWIDGLNLRP
jgi:hypothetical protein